MWRSLDTKTLYFCEISITQDLAQEIRRSLPGGGEEIQIIQPLNIDPFASDNDSEKDFFKAISSIFESPDILRGPQIEKDLVNDFDNEMFTQLGDEALREVENEMDEEKERESEKKNEDKKSEGNPFEHFEVFVNGKKVTDEKEIENDERMFKDVFKGFDFGFNPLSVAQDVHGMNQRFEKRYNLLPDPKPGEVCFRYWAGLD